MPSWTASTTRRPSERAAAARAQGADTTETWVRLLCCARCAEAAPAAAANDPERSHRLPPCLPCPAPHLCLPASLPHRLWSRRRPSQAGASEERGRCGRAADLRVAAGPVRRAAGGAAAAGRQARRCGGRGYTGEAGWLREWRCCLAALLRHVCSRSSPPHHHALPFQAPRCAPRWRCPAGRATTWPAARRSSTLVPLISTPTWAPAAT